MARHGREAYYDTYWETEGVTTRPPPELLRLFERDISSDDRCLDVGCGDGGTSGVWLNEHAGSYVGVDISDRALRKASERGLDVHRISDAAELPFPDHSFDLAVCTEVLEHLFEPQLALTEIHRVLRLGGRLIVTVPNLAHWRSRVDLALFGRWNPRGDHLSSAEPWRDPHVRFFTLTSLADLTEQSGFELLEKGGHTQFGLPYFVPGLRKLTRTPLPRFATRRLASRFPRLLAETIYVVGRADRRPR
jgi:methionine biosynthesis protein MetW